MTTTLHTLYTPDSLFQESEQYAAAMNQECKEYASRMKEHDDHLEFCAGLLKYRDPSQSMKVKEDVLYGCSDKCMSVLAVHMQKTLVEKEEAFADLAWVIEQQQREFEAYLSEQISLRKPLPHQLAGEILRIRTELDLKDLVLDRLVSKNEMLEQILMNARAEHSEANNGDDDQREVDASQTGPSWSDKKDVFAVTKGTADILQEELTKSRQSHRSDVAKLRTKS